MSKIEIIELPKIYDPRGSLSVAEEGIQVPFEMGAIEWLYPGTIHEDASRRPLGVPPLLLVALAGETHILVSEEDGKPTQLIKLHKPNQALWLKEGCLGRITQSSPQSLLLMIHKR